MTWNRKTPMMTGALVAATAALAACSGEPPLTNEEAAPKIIEQTMGKTPTEMLTAMASDFYPMFEIARGFGGERGEAWTEERFNTELAASFAPLSPQIDAAMAGYVAAQMDKGEGQALLDMLAEGRNAEFAQCAFAESEGNASARVQACVDQVGGTPDEEFLGALADFRESINAALANEDKLNTAVGYATCGVLADFGEDVSRENLTLDLRTTEMGIGGKKLPCDQYDALAAEQLGEATKITPNFAPEEGEEAAAAEAAE